MAYSELIKDFSRIRDYMRQFYIYGFRTRDEFDDKSGRSYDNERRRLESWLGEYMSFHQDAGGKVVFLSVDSQEILHNPLYQAFKAKSFTANDIVLHFYLMDILEDHASCSVTEIVELMADQYGSVFSEPLELDESTIRKKLKEYEQIGLVKSEKQGRKLLFSKTKTDVDLTEWKDAIDFFSELEPLGVIGSYILDQTDDSRSFFHYKHHYILHALESEIMYVMLDSISRECTAHIRLFSRRKGKMMEYDIVPLKILISTQNGRSYVLGKNLGDGNYNLYRLDNIKEASCGNPAEDWEMLLKAGEEYLKYHWNTSAGRNAALEHLEMILNIEPWAGHILQRLEKEGKHGSVEPLGNHQYKYAVDVYDTGEMLPWIRTFIGRIVSLRCTNKVIEKQFYDDLEQMYAMYGGDDHVV
ncbi:MAG: WYL domain-containing protein [Firmicutes bacterium]|nr:WYL domain-containing protein [Bacillota bacterium]